MQTTIKIEDQAVRDGLQALAQRLRNPGAALQAVGEDLVSRTKARFDTSTDPAGNTWKAKKRPNGRPTLVGDTGDLRRQIVAAVAGTELTILANAPGGYSAIHQFGGTIEREAGEVTVRHRTNAKGELLRSAIMNGKGLIFARWGDRGHKRYLERTFAHQAYTITIPSRPYLPVLPDGSLYPDERDLIVAQIEGWL